MYYKLLQFPSGKRTSMWNIQVSKGSFARTKRRSRTANETGCRTNHQSLSKRNGNGYGWNMTYTNGVGEVHPESFFVSTIALRQTRISTLDPFAKKNNGCVVRYFSYFFLRQESQSPLFLETQLSECLPEWIQGSFRVYSSCPRNMTCLPRNEGAKHVYACAIQIWHICKCMYVLQL